MELKQVLPVTSVGAQPAVDGIRLFELKNSKGTVLTVSNYGGAVVSLLVAGRHGILEDVVLGYQQPEEYINDNYYLGTIVGRYANRISGDTVTIDGNVYKLFTKDGGYHLHGGKVGFNKRLFNAAPFEQAGRHGITFSYTSAHLEEGFPGELQLDITYSLDDENAWTVEYRAVADKTTLINLTQHTYFNLTGNPATKIDDHLLRINSQHYLPVNELQVPTGEIANVEGTPFDFRQLKKIGADLFNDHAQLRLSNGYDHSFALEQQHTPIMKYAAEVQDPVSGRRMEVYTMQPAVHFYSGNFLSEVKGKKGITYDERSGFCLETQHFPDAPRHQHFPSTILKAGTEFYSKTVYRFSVVD